MTTEEISNTVKKEPSFSIEGAGKKVEAWRKKNGYIVKWTGFGIGEVAPRLEKPRFPFFWRYAKKRHIVLEWEYIFY